MKLAASVLLLGAASLPAAVVYWDADGTAIGNNYSSGAGLGGSGTWNASISNWWDGTSPSDAAFPDTGTDTAIFTGTGGIVQLGSAITVQTLTFNSDGFTITGGTGGTNALTLASSNAINVNVAGTATVSAVVAGSGGLTLNSATTGTLALTGVNTYTGLTTVNGGTLSVASSGNLNSGNNLTVGAPGKATFDNGSQDLGTVLNSGRVDFTDTGGTITLGPVTNGGSGIMNFAGGTNTLGAVINGGVMNFTNVGADNTLASLTGAGATNFSGYTIITGQFDTGTATFGGTGEIGTAASGTLYMNGFSNKITTLNGDTTVIFGSAPNSYGLPIPVDLTVHDGSAAGAISGDGSLTVTGPLTLSGNNTYTLGTTVDGGVLLVGNGGTSGTLGTGAVILNNDATLAFNRSDNYGGAVSNNINGAGGVTLNAGTLALTGSNGYTGPTTLNGGTLQVGNGGTSGTLGTGAVILNNDATLAFNRSDNYGGAVSNNINGAGGVTLNAGTLALTGSNGYTGPTTLNGGILVMTSASQIGSAGSINFSGGQLQASGTFALGNAIHVTTTTSGVIVDENETLTLNGNITGGNSLVKQGPGLLVLTGTTDATTVVNAGSVSVTSTSAGPSLTVNSGADVTFNQPVGGGTYSNPISGAGDVTVIGTLTLAGDGNSFTGNLTIASRTIASTVLVASPSNLGGAEVQLTSTTTTTPATLQITGGGTYSNPITVGDGITTGVTGLVIYTGNVAVTFSGTLNKNGTTFELVGSNSLGGTVTITGQITGNTGSLNSDMSYNGGTFNLNGASPNTYFGPTYLTNAVTVNANSVGALPTLNGRSPVVMDQTGSGSSNLVLGDNQSIAALTGATSSSVNLNGKTLTIGTDSGSTTFAGAISGAGGLIKDGASTLTLSGANTYTGTTIINGGTVTLNRNTGSLNGNALTFGGTGTFNMDNTGAGGALAQSLGALTFSAGDGTVKITRTEGQDQTLTFSSLATRGVGATGNFVNTGGTNSATNGFILTGVTANAAMSPGYFFNGGTASANYAFYDSAGFVRGINWVGGGDAGTTTQAGGAITGTAYAQSTGSTTATINGQAFTGLNFQNTTGIAQAVNITGAITTDGILRSGNGASTTTISGGTSIKTTTDGADLVIRTDMANDALTITTPILVNGASGLTKSGAGTVTLSAANTYTGQTNVTAGTLTTSGTMVTTAVSVSSGASFTGTNTGANSAMATNADVTNDGAMSLAASQTISTLNGATTGATLAAARGSTLNITGGGTYAGAINDVSGTGTGANLTAGGSLMLQGNNGYTGATVVSVGATLAVTGSGAVAGTSSVTVNSGATLQLNAAATNAVNSGAAYVSNGGTLSIGPNLQTLASMTLGSAASSTLNFNNLAGTLSFGSLDGSTKTALSSSPITLNIENWVGSAYTIGTSSVTLDPSQSSFIFSNDPGFILGQVIPGVYFAGYGAGMAVTVQVAGGGTAYQIVPATVVPEPATAALLGSVALCALIGCRKRRRSPGF